jgi:hypothetical protein
MNEARCDISIKTVIEPLELAIFKIESSPVSDKTVFESSLSVDSDGEVITVEDKRNHKTFAFELLSMDADC